MAVGVVPEQFACRAAAMDQAAWRGWTRQEPQGCVPRWFPVLDSVPGAAIDSRAEREPPKAVETVDVDFADYEKFRHVQIR